MTAILFITILYELIYITGVEKMRDLQGIGGFLAVILIIYAVLSTVVEVRYKNKVKKESCVNAGYTYIDKQCLDVKVIEL